jgi:hypothetical protein
MTTKRVFEHVTRTTGKVFEWHSTESRLHASAHRVCAVASAGTPLPDNSAHRVHEEARALTIPVILANLPGLLAGGLLVMMWWHARWHAVD